MFKYALYRMTMDRNLIWMSDYETFDAAYKKAVDGIHNWHKEWYVIVNKQNSTFTNVYDLETYGKDERGNKLEYDKYGFAISK